ncbi:uncharacterized protein [Aegilops tauschii subsp. strangulata]|uniref:uncharacterized protein n=1 Tax=Aegilops tauschii subsp. strangulata TaxID=200361 RepID=UPI003CC83EA8
MEAFQERMLKEFAEIRAAQRKLLIIDGSAQLEALDAKLTDQGAWLDQVQQSQAHAAQMHKQQGVPEVSSPAASEISDDILGVGPRFVGRPPSPPIQVPEVQHGQQPPIILVVDESMGKRQWMPKMDFPKFDGTDVRIWLDKCEAFFRLYHIPDSFKVTSASLYLSDNATCWYHAFKQSGEFHTWEQFCQTILLEFDVDVYRQKMKELMLLKQANTVEEYKKQFLQLVYTIKLYEPTISDTFLVTRFVLGLKEELRSAVEFQISGTVQLAALYASVQEGLLLQQKTHKPSFQKASHNNTDSRSRLAAGELWKAKQLKEYRRANGLCYKCGDKFVPGHVCNQPAAGVAHLKAAEYQGKDVRLQGVLPVQQENLEEIFAEQLLKWEKGNDVWATALLNRIIMAPVTEIPHEVKQVLDRNKQVFQEPHTLPPHRAFDHTINLAPDAAPVNCRPYRYSPLQTDEIEKQVKEMLDAGLITPSISPFVAPVLLVKKKYGTWRFCVDYRRLNAITVKNKFPMPVIDEILDELGGAKWFSKMDLRAGYHQIKMKEEDEFKTAFKTHHGQFQFRVMPFGLATAPGTFQCVMNFAFAGANRKYVLVFMDDILVFSGTLEEHIEHLQSVFDILKENQLFVKEIKCTFA